MTQKQIDIHARRAVRRLARAESYVAIEVVEGAGAPRLRGEAAYRTWRCRCTTKACTTEHARVWAKNPKWGTDYWCSTLRVEVGRDFLNHIEHALSFLRAPRRAA